METEFLSPPHQALIYGARQAIVWSSSTRVGSQNQPKLKKINISHLPQRFASTDGFIPFPEAVDTLAFDLQSVPTHPLKLGGKKDSTIAISETRVGIPERIVIKSAHCSANSISNILLLGEEEGLPSIAINAILESSDGFLWLASEQSLMRIRGERLESFPIKCPGVEHMFSDSKGRIWMQGRMGVQYFDPKTRIIGKIDIPRGRAAHVDGNGFLWLFTYKKGLYILNLEKKQIRHFAADTDSAFADCTDASIDLQGNFWITHEGHGVDIVSADRKEIRHLSGSTGLREDSVFSVFVSGNGDIWLSEVNGWINVIDVRHHRITRFTVSKYVNVFGDQATQDDQGRIWLNTRGLGILGLDLNRKLFFPVSVKQGLNWDDVVQIARDSHNRLWVATADGCDILNFNGPLLGSLSPENGLHDGNIWGIMRSHEGKIWLTTYNGLDIYDPEKRVIQHLGKQEGLTYEAIAKVAEDLDGNIWINQNNIGFYKTNSRTGVAEVWGHQQGLDIRLALFIITDKRGFVWCSDDRGNVWVISPREKTVRKLMLAGLSASTAITIKESPSGEILLGANNVGVFVLDQSLQTIQKITIENGLQNLNILSLCGDSFGRLWIGTEDGLEIISPKAKQIYHVNRDQGLKNDNIYSLTTHGDEVFAGTGAGISRLKIIESNLNAGTKDASFTCENYGRGQGLPIINFNQDVQLFSDSDLDYFAASPFLTAMRFDKHESSTLTPFITGLDISNKSVSFFHGDSTHVNDSTLGGRWAASSLEWDSLSGPFFIPTNLRLPDQTETFNIQFTAGEMVNLDKVRYRYILQGFDKSWSVISQKASTDDYRNVPPGNYVFEVRARGANGRWSDPVILPIEIITPWYQRWWAYGVYTLLSGLFIWQITKYRSRRLRVENVRLESTVQQRTEELTLSLDNLKAAQSQLIQSEKMASLGELTAGIAHEIQNPLNFVNNFSEVNSELLAEMRHALDAGDIAEAVTLSRDVEDNTQKVIHHGKRADSIVKGMLVHSRAKATSRELNDVNALVEEFLNLSYHSIQSKDQSFRANLHLDLNPSIGRAMINASEIGRVLLNIFDNAFYSLREKFAKEIPGYIPSLLVQTERIEGQIIIRIRDNGNGIAKTILKKVFQPFFTTKPAGEGTGLGLSMSYDIIVKSHNGKLIIDSQETEFTLVTIGLPA